MNGFWFNLSLINIKNVLRRPTKVSLKNVLTKAEKYGVITCVYVGNWSRLSNRLWMRYETVQQVLFLVIDLIRLNSIWFMNYGSSSLLQQFVWSVKVFKRSDKLWFITAAEFAFSTKPILNAMLSSADSTRFVSVALLNPFDKFISVFRFRINTKL